MEGPSYSRGFRGRGGVAREGARSRPQSRNKQWTTPENGTRGSTPNNSDSERWERGGHHGVVRGRGALRGKPKTFPNVSLHVNSTSSPLPPKPIETQDATMDDGDEQREDGDDEDSQDIHFPEIKEPELNTLEEREKFYQGLVKAREVERKKAIADGKMDDPHVRKRLEDALSIVGTCMDMCPRFERYRRERENNLFEWETIPGTKRVDHKRAVKMYERAVGDKCLPSDLRPPPVLKRTLDYLFHDLLPRGGFSSTYNFIRDRTRAIRNDFSLQHLKGASAMESHDRCVRFHILTLHLERNNPGFTAHLEEKQLMNSLQSLKEFYSDQRGIYQSPTEIEMRVYHRLIHIRDMMERHEDTPIPQFILSNPMYKLATEFREHVQKKSYPIEKTSRLIVGDEGMQIFSQLAAVLHEHGNRVIMYLVACLMEHVFGTDTIEDIESIKGDLSIQDIIDGVSSPFVRQSSPGIVEQAEYVDNSGDTDVDEFLNGDEGEEAEGVTDAEPENSPPPVLFKPNGTERTNSQSSNLTVHTPAPAQPPVQNAFAQLVSTPNVFSTKNVFGGLTFPISSSPAAPSVPSSVFGNLDTSKGIFGAISTPTVTPPPPPQPSTSTSTPFYPAMNGSPHPPQSIFPPSSINSGLFGNKQTSVANVTPTNTQETSAQISGTPFFNPFGNVANGNLPHSLNPRASEFNPSPTQKLSFFSQPPEHPSLNGNAKPVIEAPPLMPPSTFTPPPFDIKDSALPESSHTIEGYPFKSSPPPAISNTPPPIRPAAPPLLKINTNSSSSSSEIDSPKVPPPLFRKQPIPLPPTPSTSFQLSTPLVDRIRRNTMDPSPISASGSQILSPLVLGSPTTSKSLHNFTPLTTPRPSKVFRASSSSPPPMITNGKGKAPVRSVYDYDDIEKMKKKASAFAGKSLLVKKTFRLWLERTTDRAAYIEARQHSEDYREKLNHVRKQPPILRTPLTNGNGLVPHDRKRRITNGVQANDSPSPKKKRPRKRISAEYRPAITDEELAKRFKESQEEHDLRWAPGSFLQVFCKHVKCLNPSILKMPWHIWLSMNPESDATAIWLERKFAMPESGLWISEALFSMPLSPTSNPTSAGYPGVVVFECTPLGDITDELDKKYRVLDDCSRLREIVKSLPAKRHFIPSLLIISWCEGEEQVKLPGDFSDMVNTVVDESTFQRYQVFAMSSTTKDLDNKLDAALSSLDLDTTGKLVRHVPMKELFKIFEPTFNSFLSEWMENCFSNGRTHWNVYGKVVPVVISFLNYLSELAQKLFNLSGPLDSLPDFDGSQLDDSESAYEDAISWLSNFEHFNDAKLVAIDLESHRNIGQEFPPRIFIEHLFQMSQTLFEKQYPSLVDIRRPILHAEINTAIQAFNDFMRPRQLELLQSYNFSVRRSPKRKPYSITSSEMGSTGSKRRRLSSSIASNDDEPNAPSTPQRSMSGHHSDSPSPTNSNTTYTSEKESQGPTVTAAMLRALTKDITKKYRS